MRYVVKATCYWDNRYYKKGEAVDLDSTATPPEHFEPIDKPKKKEVVVEQPKVEVAEKPKQDEPKVKATKAKAKAKKNG